jgi:pentatricopeptide repeat protein
MSASYVCHTCRRELQRRLRRRQNLQWLPRATFISFGEIVPPQKEKSQDAGEERTPRPRLRRHQSEDVGDGATVHGAEDAEKSALGVKQGLGRYSRFGVEAREAPSNSDFKINNDNLRSLRGSLLRRLDSLSPAEASRLIPPLESEERAFEPPERTVTADVSMETDTPAVKLWQLLSMKGHDAKEAWEMFEDYYIKPGKKGAALRRPSDRDKAIIRDKKLFREVLRSVASQWLPGDDRLPAPAEVVSILHDYGVMGEGWYLLEILEMLYRTIRLNAHSREETASESRLILEEQVLSLWSQFLRNCPNEMVKGKQLKSEPANERQSNWNGTPDPESIHFSKTLGRDAYRFPFRMHRLFSSVPSASTQHLAAAALFTFDYFTHQYCRSYAVRDDRIQYEPFLRLIMRALHGAQDIELAASLGTSLLEDNNIPQEAVDEIANRLGHLRQRAALAVAIDDLQVLGSENINLTEEQENKLIAYFHGRIKRQIERQNRGVIDELWQQALLAYSSADNGDDGPSNLIPPKIYSAFLFGYRDLQEPERQAEIWNHMLASGMTPTHEQWGLMISARMKHLNSMEHIWERMHSSGTKPDHMTWCTRLSSHIYYGNPEEAIQILYQWGNSWYEEVRKIFTDHNVSIPEMARLTRDGPTIPRPKTDALTTVITALVQRKGGQGRRLDLVPDAFAWAQTFAVKPNLWCYNTLFRTCLRDGNLKEAMQILAKMEEESITPDAYTFYAFADFIFKQSNKSVMTEDEQYKLMFSVLDMLEMRGLDPNAVFFGSMIDGLLKRGPDNVANIGPAMMLLRIMTDKNIAVSSQIWTSLMTHYFQEGRRLASEGNGAPDWAAIEALWRRMNQTQPLSLDAIFYDRMIEGFAGFGEIARAATMLERMRKEGKRPGWSALTALLTAYVEQHFTEQARALVNDVVSGTGLLKDGVRTVRDTSRNPARERFFEAATQAGVLSGREDLNAVREYGIGDSAGMELPPTQQEIYSSKIAFSSGGDRSGYVEQKSGEWKSMEQIEATFSKQMDLMPGWDEVVEKKSAVGGR